MPTSRSIGMLGSTVPSGFWGALSGGWIGAGALLADGVGTGVDGARRCTRIHSFRSPIGLLVTGSSLAVTDRAALISP